MLKHVIAEAVVRLLREAVDLEPNAAEMLKLGGVYQALGQTREAEKWYQHAEDVCENAEAKVSVLVSKAHLSGSDQAIVAALHKVAEKYPNVSPMKMAAEFLVHYEALGEMDKGMAYFEISDCRGLCRIHSLDGTVGVGRT